MQIGVVGEDVARGAPQDGQLRPGAILVINKALASHVQRDDLVVHVVPFDEMVVAVCKEAKLRTIELLRSLGMLEQSVALAEQCVADCEAGFADPVSLGLARLLAGEAQLAAGDRGRAAGHLRAVLVSLEGVREPIAQGFRARAEAALARAGHEPGEE